MMICTKAGIPRPRGDAGGLPSEDVVGGMHSMSPVFLRINWRGRD